MKNPASIPQRLPPPPHFAHAAGFFLAVFVLFFASCTYEPPFKQFYFGVAPSAVDFDTDGGSAVSGQVVLAGGKATRPADPFKSGYTFAGWYTDSGCTVPWSFETAVDTDQHLYAKWVAAVNPYDREDFGTNAAIEYAAPVGVDSAQTWVAAIDFINNNTGSGDNYVIDITGSFVLLEAAGTAGSNPHITRSGAVVSVRGRNGAAVSLGSAPGNLLSARSGTTIILRDLTLMGHAANTSALVTVEGGLILKEGAAVCGNGSYSSSTAHGVAVTGAGAQFAMEGNARVHNNNWNGVHITGSNAEFTMGGAAQIYGNGSRGVSNEANYVKMTIGGNAQIHDNSAHGVYSYGFSLNYTMGGNAQIYNSTYQGIALEGSGTAIMNGNTQVYNNGGSGVSIGSTIVFDMGGNAQIYGNRPNSNGGGVAVYDGTFIMGGNAQIYGNSADEGGGVYIHGSGKLYITGGVIYGTNAPDSLKNTANPGSGAALYEGSGTAEMGSFGSSGALPLASSPQPLSSTDDTILWAP